MGRSRIEIFGGPRNLPTTTGVRAADKLISCLRLPSPRPLLLDSWLVALAAAGPRNCILTRFLVCLMWHLAFRRGHLSDLHTLNDLRDTSAALCRDEGSNFRSIKCETSSGSSEMISTLLGTNKPTTRSRDLKKLHVASTVARARLTVWLRVEAHISAVRHGALRVPVPGESPGEAESMVCACIFTYIGFTLWLESEARNESSFALDVEVMQ